MHKRIKRIVKFDGLAALITTVLVIILVTVPLAVMINNTVFQIADVVSKRSIAIPCNVDSSICDSLNQLNEFIASPASRTVLQETISKSSNSLIGITSNLLLSIPNLIASLFIMLFTMFYFFLDGTKIKQSCHKYLPFSSAIINRFQKSISDMTHAVVYGYIVVAFIQAILGVIGFYIFGIPNPLFWGVILFIASLLPLIGPTIVWIPLGLYKLYFALALQTAPLWQGIGLLIYGALLISGTDNLLKAKITGDKAKVHPVIVLIGALGGLQLMGFIGVIVGPLIFGLFISVLEIIDS